MHHFRSFGDYVFRTNLNSRYPSLDSLVKITQEMRFQSNFVWSFAIFPIMIAKISFSFKRFTWKTAKKLVSVETANLMGFWTVSKCQQIPSFLTIFCSVKCRQLQFWLLNDVLALWVNTTHNSRYYARLTETHSQALLLNPSERCQRVLLDYIGCYVQNTSKFSSFAARLSKRESFSPYF